MTNISLLKNDTVFNRRESNVRSYCRRLGVVFDTARGSLIIDESGRQYVDFLAGCASLNYGQTFGAPFGRWPPKHHKGRGA